MYGGREVIEVERLIGRTVKEISGYSGDGCFLMEDGKKVWFYHDQDCCEFVRVYKVRGDLKDLEGKKIISASVYFGDPDDVDYKPYDSYTWTTFTFVAEDNTKVEVVWLGESNGYYGESVYISEENA